MKPVKIASPPRFGVEFSWDALSFGKSNSFFSPETLTIVGIEKKVIAKDKKRLQTIKSQGGRYTPKISIPEFNVSALFY
jgi:hypothetical protein